MSEKELYLQHRFFFFSNLLDKTSTQHFLTEFPSFSSRRVVCGGAGVSWDEFAVPEESQLFRFFHSEKILSIVFGTAGIPRQNYKASIWVNRYKEGEYINPHRDNGGSTQLLVCLRGTDESNGGGLFLEESKGVAHHLQLKAGEAVLFEATTLKHWTTPLVATPNHKSPIREVAVARYYI